MLTYSDAIKLMAQEESTEGGALCYEREHWFGWVFVYQSQKYLASGNCEDMWVGNGPFLVNRFTGNLHSFGSADGPTSRIVRRYQLKCISAFGGGLLLIALLMIGYL